MGGGHVLHAWLHRDLAEFELVEGVLMGPGRSRVADVSKSLGARGGGDSVVVVMEGWGTKGGLVLTAQSSDDYQGFRSASKHSPGFRGNWHAFILAFILVACTLCRCLCSGLPDWI